MLLTLEEKLDMISHELVHEEAEIMSFLIEQEYAVLDNNMTSINKLDMLMEGAVKHQIFRKYMAYTRLQATIVSAEESDQRKDFAKDEDVNLIEYAAFLKDRFKNYE